MTDDDRGLTFRLPPLRLPPLFPDTLRIRLPAPGFRAGRELSTGWVLSVCLVFDLFDMALALTVSGPVDLVRTLGGALIAVIVAEAVGTLYLWEVLAVLAPVTHLTVAPTLTGVFLLRVFRGRPGADRR